MVAKTKILIIGASGLLGSKLYEQLSEQYKIIGTCFKNKAKNLYTYDLAKKNLTIFKETKPDIVIHTAGITDVDYCETNQEEAYKINVAGTEKVIQGCKLNDSKLIYLSTDFIFDGKKGSYIEEDLPNPLNYYGKTKLKSEQLVKGSGLNYIIARTSFLYGSKQNKKFVSWCINKLNNEEYITLIADHMRTPTLVDDIAEALNALILKKRQGTYHLTGSEKLSPFSMAVRIAEIFNFDKKYLKPITSHKLNWAAQRPKNTSLNIQKLQQEGIQMSSFVEGLEKIKEQKK
ncbi:MAG: dTDP-4-dehydrorhamnose reductase [Nanoarchaeota archaeon]|nr:dTDP-4-dehydrorhamnose reductase [Nanoarchaeota archaeon]